MAAGESDMSEKRRAIRKDVATDLPVTDVNTGRVVGELVNISSAGFMLFAATPLAPHSVFQLSLQIPKPVRGIDTLYFGAECLWCSPADRPDRYWIGFHLIDISQQEHEALEYFVESV
jgi:hypothetical protein